ncbi:hypothetical protein niasHT_024657 [Heterodera trifolii]|uniref:Uncharacterized protein n=1 Tax=Heterodera trifolii TaxID=157864 RepID=A0ABD2K7N0_9BILA
MCRPRRAAAFQFAFLPRGAVRPAADDGGIISPPLARHALCAVPALPLTSSESLSLDPCAVPAGPPFIGILPCPDG